jgi:hypothetical protein
VPKKEGHFRRVAHPQEWYNPAFKRIIFHDNNILADKEWFMEVTEWCMERKLEMWFNQGLDIRLVDIDIAKQLHKTRNFHHMIPFSFDDLKYEGAVRKGIELLKEAGFIKNMLRAKVQFYVYVDSDDDYDNGVYRCRELKKLGCNSYLMFNVDNEQTQRITNLKRWSKGKCAYWKFDVADYNPHLSIRDEIT